MKPRPSIQFKLTQERIVLLILILLLGSLSLWVPGFAATENLLSLLQTVSILGILGLGMAVVIIGRGIDLSMIATLVVPPALLLELVQNGHSLSAAFLAALCLTLVFGVVNGWLIAYAEIPPLFVTLATGLLLAGIGQMSFFTLEVIQWSPSMNPLLWLGQGRAILGVPNSIFMFVFVTFIVGYFMRGLRIGRFIYALGDNPNAARTSGIPTRPLMVLQYVLSALIAALAGLILAASVGSTTTRLFNSNMIYDVILVVILGGIGLSGGRGGVLNVVLGTVLIGTLVNAMTILDLGYQMQNLIKGGILLLAIVVDSFVNPRNEETAQQGDI